jgi:hypothetical protein
MAFNIFQAAIAREHRRNDFAQGNDWICPCDVCQQCRHELLRHTGDREQMRRNVFDFDRATARMGESPKGGRGR